MPGLHIDKIVSDLTAKLNYTPLTQEQVKTSTKEEIELDNKNKANSVGGDVFREVENSDLTPEEKQEVHQKLGKVAMQQELTNANNRPTTFLRLATPRTNYITAFLKEYAQDYNHAVLESAKKEVDGINIPKDPGLSERFPVMGAPQDFLSKEKPETLQSLTDTTENVAKRLVEIHDDNLHKLSPEAQEFLKSTMEPVQLQNNKSLTAMAMSSTLMLKNTAPMIGEYAQSIGGSQQKVDNLTETAMKGNVLLQASKVMQTYGNNVHKDPGAKLTTKAQDVMTEKLLTSENLDRTNNSYKAVANGGQELTDLNTQLALKEQSAKVLETQRQLQANLKPFDNRIQQLQDRQKQLKESPTFGDKFKAFFQHGLKGVKGEIEKLEGKIEVTKVAKESVAQGKSMEDLQKKLDGMKLDRAEFLQAMELAKGVVVLNNASKSLNMKPSVTDAQVEKAISTHERAKPEAEHLSTQIKQQEKVMSVREKLGPNTPEHGHGEKQSTGVHL